MRRSRWVSKLWIAVALSAALGCGDDDTDSGLGNGSNPFGNANGAGRGGARPGTGAGGDGQQNSACPEGFARTTLIKPRVILVVDGSCSMSTPYPANGAPSATRCENNGNSRWAALRNALVGNNGVVRRLSSAIDFGLVVFGTQPQCPLTDDPIVPTTDNFGAIDDALGRTPPGMFTPTGPALDYVYENLILGPAADEERGPEIVVLATDGEPNSCNEATTNYQPSVDAAMKGKMLGVTTYVISLADATGQFHDHLQQLANIGAPSGSGTLYEPSTPEQLAADLESLIGGAVGCDVALNGWVPADKACQGTVTLNDEKLGCNQPNGWTLADPRHIRLQGAACERLMRGGSVNLKAEFPCGVFMVD